MEAKEVAVRAPTLVALLPRHERDIQTTACDFELESFTPRTCRLELGTGTFVSDRTAL